LTGEERRLIQKKMHLVKT